MQNGQSQNIEMSPILAARSCGGWLAVAPKWCPFRIGVTAATEAEAEEAFRLAIARWSEILTAN